jgi:hypothetical protein
MERTMILMRFSISVIILLISFAPLRAMTYVQMKELKGADLIASRVDIVLMEYGLPAAIVDYGLATTKTRRDVALGPYRLSLTDDEWTLFYSGEKGTRKDQTYWVNPKPSMPDRLSGLKSLILRTYGNAGIMVEKNRTTNRLMARAPESLLQRHQVYQVTAILPSPMAVKEIVKKYGRDFEDTANPGMQHVIRYWVAEYLGRFPSNIFAVDFELSDDGSSAVSYTLSSVRVDHVQEKYNQLLDELRKGCPADDENAAWCGEI